MVRNQSNAEPASDDRAKSCRARVDHSQLPCTGCGGPRDRQRSRCVQCCNRARAEWRRANPGRDAATLRSWYAANREKALEHARENYRRHKPRFIAAAYEWGRKNPRKRSRIMAFQNAKRRSRQKANGGSGFSVEQWRALCEAFGGLCAYCRREPIGSIDHFVPLACGGQDDISNIVPACGSCNSRKRENEPTGWVVTTFGVERLSEIQSLRGA